MRYQCSIILICVTCFTSCKAQVSPLAEGDIYTNNSGLYYKDVDNDFDKFVGEWKWENGTNSLTIVLQKKEYLYDSNENFYEDLIIGEYKYVQNGLVIYDTLHNLNDSSIEPYYHKINGSSILANHHLPLCNDCDEGERRVWLTVEHPDYGHISGKLVMRYKIENGVEKIYARLMENRASYRLSEEEPSSLGIPFTDYVFIKQD